LTRDVLDKIAVRTAVYGAKQWYITVKSNQPLCRPQGLLRVRASDKLLTHYRQRQL